MLARIPVDLTVATPQEDRTMITEPTAFKIAGNSFFDCNGLLESRAEPFVFGTGNVIWPRGWTEAQAAQWREEHGVPGREWRPRGETP